MRLRKPIKPLWLTVKLLTVVAMGTTVATTAAAFTSYERQIVAAVLVLEAADQGEVGMRAVMHVIDNRARNNPARAIGQVARRRAFSSLNNVTNQRHPDYGPVLRRAMRDPMWPLAMRLVEDYEAGRLGPDLTYGATHYCVHPPPAWRRELAFLTKIGDHRFYR